MLNHLQTDTQAEPLIGDHYSRQVKLNTFKQHLYTDAADGLSVRELLTIPRITRMIFASTMLFVRFNMYNMLVQFPETLTVFSSHNVLLLGTQELGQIAVGIACMIWFYGRMACLFIWLCIGALAIDLLSITLMAATWGSTASQVFIVLQGFFTFMLFFLAILVFPLDIGKVELLTKNRMVIGQLFGIFFLVIYVTDSVLFANLETFFFTQLDGNSYQMALACQVMMTVALALALIPMSSLYRKEMHEMRLIRN